jgi:hypothetical protein
MTRTTIPIRLKFLRIPITWEIRAVAGRSRGQHQLFAFAKQLHDDSSGDVAELDGWKCREEFFALKENDNDALLKFLTKVGVWLRDEGELMGHWSKEVMRHYSEGHPVPIDVRGLWKFRDSLKRALMDRWLPETKGIEFPLSFELAGFPAGVVTVTDAYHLLLATVFVDAAQRIRFKICQRKDCGKPFPLENKHKKKFCCWYCGHITTVRRNRPRSGSKKKA